MTGSKRLKVFRGPRIVQASQILKKKTIPSAPMILAFSEDEWKKAIGGAEVAKEPPPRDAVRLFAFTLPPEWSSNGQVGVIPYCLSTPTEDCFPVTTVDPEKALIYDCRCIPRDDYGWGDITDTELSPARRKKCHLVWEPDGTFKCEGSCKKPKKCVKVYGEPSDGVRAVWCECRGAQR